MHKLTALVLIGLMMVGLAGCSGRVSQEEYDAIVDELSALEKEYEELEKAYEDVKLELDAWVKMLESGEIVFASGFEENDDVSSAENVSGWEDMANILAPYCDIKEVATDAISNGTNYLYITTENIEDISSFMNAALIVAVSLPLASEMQLEPVSIISIYSGDFQVVVSKWTNPSICTTFIVNEGANEATAKEAEAAYYERFSMYDLKTLT